MERDISGGSGKIPVIVAAAVALASLISLIPGCLREFLCLLLQQLIQRFFHTAADQFLDLTLDNFLVQLYNSLRHGLQSPFRMLCRNFILPEFANYVSFSLLSFCATYLTLSRTVLSRVMRKIGLQTPAE